MPRSLKIILFIVGGFVGLLVLVTVGLFVFVNANAYKSRLETAASGALGMEVKAGGSLGIGFFPGLHVTMKDVHIRNRGTDVASAKAASLNVDFIPLLRHEVRIREIELKSPTISLERGDDGKFNFETTGQARGTFPAMDLAKVSFADGTLSYADKKSGAGYEAGHCNLDLRRLQLSAGESAELLKHLSFTAQFACGEIRSKKLVASGLKLSIAGKEGIFDLKPITMRIFGGQGSGSIRADFSGGVPLYHFSYSLPQFRIEEFFKTLSPKKVAEGAMDFSANLTMEGETADEVKRTTDGEVSLRGKSITLTGRDLDRELSRFESSQNFNLVDTGAFFFAGPFGLLVTKGYNFASIFHGSGGSSTIRTLVSDWKVERGVAQAKDVALATKENRIALKGKLDFVTERFDDVTMALIDAKGCAKVQQKIIGPFRKPVVEQPNVFKSLAGPVLRLFKRGRDLFPGGQCEVFYAGSVAAPK
jgi:uncharacterized protein involved in outer membrane biogenesis